MRNKKAKALRKYIKAIVKDKSEETTYVGGTPPVFEKIPLSLLWRKTALGIPIRVSDDCIRFYNRSFKKYVKKHGVVEGD